MQSTQNRPVPRAVDDRRRGSAHYYSDVYDQVEQFGAQRSPTRENPVSPTQHQQRIAPVEQGRPPVANNATQRRGGAAAEGMPRPPSYPGQGSPHEDLISKTNEAIKQSQQQQSRRRGYRRTDESGDEPTVAASNLPFDSREVESSKSASTSRSNQSVPNTRTRAEPIAPQRSAEPQRRSPRGADNSALTAGNSIVRLNSPSVMSSVLQPLNGKIQEYGTQMNDAQNLMDQMDVEIAALQERRREAEKHYMAAKTKHDDYRRQYQGVERALKGEPDISFSRLSVDSERPSTQQTVQHEQQRIPQNEAMRSRTESWNSMNSSKREAGGGRFRISKLFS